MIAYLSLCLLLAASPPLFQAKSISNHENPAGLEHAIQWQTMPRFLQIARKSCRSADGRPGTCMFNFQCQQQRGQVVAPCLDGFLFGACCHLSANNAITSVISSAVEAAGIQQSTHSFKQHVTPASFPWQVDDGLSTDSFDIDDLPLDMGPVASVPSSIRLPGVEDSALLNSNVEPPVDSVAEASIATAVEQPERAEETTIRIPASSSTLSHKRPANQGNVVQISQSVSNQISEVSTENVAGLADLVAGTFGGSSSSISPIIFKEDPQLQAQLEAILFAHTTQFRSPAVSETTEPDRSMTVHIDLNQSPPVSPSSTEKPKPTRKVVKRPRPKPGANSNRKANTTTTTPPTTTTSSTTPSTTTTTPSTTTTTTTTTPSTTTTKTTTTTTTTTTTEVPSTEPGPESVDVLQFLVSNPPAWVLEELINGTNVTGLSTWFPFPAPDQPVTAPPAIIPVSSAPVRISSTGKPKRKPSRRPAVKTTTTTTTSTTEATPLPQLKDEPSTAPTTTTSTEPPTTVALTTTTTTPTTTTTTTTTTQPTTTTTKKPRPVFDFKKDCGVRPMVPEARIVGGRRSDYGKWPWQVLIRESTWFGIFSKNKCGGVLISDRHVLTAAHCQPGFLGSLLVVLGEFDLTGSSEPNTPIEKNVKRVVIHRDYVERTFENDLAILELETPVEFRPYVVPICLPTTSDGDFHGQKAEVTGWGKLSHNGPTPGVLYEVDVPIMSNPECHDMFKKAGHEKRILDSFVCAGYTEGKKDSCEGDSGGPLMVERDDGRWTLVGTVSHGIRCAYPNMPGVYMRMTYYRPWIERVTGVGGNQLG